MQDLFDSLTDETPAPAGDGFQVGDFLVSSWGYGQTNIDFFKVTKRTPKTVTFVKWNKKVVGGAQFGKVVPSGSASTWQGEEQVYKNRRIKSYGGEGSVNVSTYSTAWPWDGMPCHDTLAAGQPGH